MPLLQRVAIVSMHSGIQEMASFNFPLSLSLHFSLHLRVARKARSASAFSTISGDSVVVVVVCSESCSSSCWPIRRAKSSALSFGSKICSNLCSGLLVAVKKHRAITGYMPYMELFLSTHDCRCVAAVTSPCWACS